MKERFNILVEPFVILFTVIFRFILGGLIFIAIPILLLVPLFNYILSIIFGEKRVVIGMPFDIIEIFDKIECIIGFAVTFVVAFVITLSSLINSFGVFDKNKCDPKQVIYQEVQACNETKNEYYSEPICYIKAD